MRKFYIFATIVVTLKFLLPFIMASISIDGYVNFSLIDAVTPIILITLYFIIIKLIQNENIKKYSLITTSIIVLSYSLVYPISSYFYSVISVNNYLSQLRISNIKERVEMYNGMPIGVRVSYDYYSPDINEKIKALNEHEGLPMLDAESYSHVKLVSVNSRNLNEREYIPFYYEPNSVKKIEAVILPRGISMILGEGGDHNFCKDSNLSEPIDFLGSAFSATLGISFENKFDLTTINPEEVAIKEISIEGMGEVLEFTRYKISSTVNEDRIVDTYNNLPECVL